MTSFRAISNRMTFLLGAWVSYYRGQLDRERTAFCDDWLQKRDEGLAWMGVSLGIFFHAISFIIDPAVSSSEISISVLRMVHVTFLVVISIWFVVGKRLGIPIKQMNIPGQLISISGYGYLVHHFVLLHPEIDVQVVRIWMAYVSLATFQILVTASHNVLVPGALAGLYLAGGAYAWSSSPYMLKIVPLSGVIVVMAVLFQFGLVVKAVEEALREFDARQKLAAAERASLERDLELARGIQDSLSPPASLRRGNMIAYCFQRKHSQVGGDWAAMRLDETGALYVVVADAAGKGMQAALVVHAVQSLWAETLGRGDFQAEAWLQRVNHALCQLGERQPHMVTMGILKIENGRCTYWSAGHLPLFLVGESKTGDAEVRVVLGRGSPLGLREEIVIEPAGTRIDGPGALSILLGSDGVFDKGTVHRSKEIVGMRDGLRLRGYGVLEDCQAEDDKTLIWIDRAA